MQNMYIHACTMTIYRIGGDFCLLSKMKKNNIIAYSKRRKTLDWKLFNEKRKYEK